MEEKRKKRIYISGPITGVPDYMQRFMEVQKNLEESGYSVVNPALVNSNMPEETEYEEYMKMALTMLEMADGIYMMDGWRDSCGSNREYGYALGKGLPVLMAKEVERE